LRRAALTRIGEIEQTAPGERQRSNR
jgi:hypothetical protein